MAESLYLNADPLRCSRFYEVEIKAAKPPELKIVDRHGLFG